MFDIPHMMTQGNPNETTNTVARFIYMQGFTGSRNFNMASAASVVLFVIIIIGSLIIRYVLNDHDPKPGKIAKKGAIK
jgi:multiple sugar transport system permease protein